jgi:hypothetical protein
MSSQLVDLAKTGAKVSKIGRHLLGALAMNALAREIGIGGGEECEADKKPMITPITASTRDGAPLRDAIPSHQLRLGCKGRLAPSDFRHIASST